MATSDSEMEAIKVLVSSRSIDLGLFVNWLFIKADAGGLVVVAEGEGADGGGRRDWLWTP